MAAFRQIRAIDALENRGFARARTAGNAHELTRQHAQRDMLAAAYATVGGMQGKALGKILDRKERTRIGLKEFDWIAHYLSSDPSVSITAAGT